MGGLCISPQFKLEGLFRVDILDPQKAYLDTAASHHVFPEASAEFVSNIHATDNVLETSCNAGVTSSNTQGVFAGEIYMWGVPNGIATLVSYIQHLNEMGGISNMKPGSRGLAPHPVALYLYFKLRHQANAKACRTLT